MRICEWLQDWYENYVMLNMAASTRDSYEGIIRQHLNPNIGQCNLETLKKRDIDQLYHKLLTSGRVERPEAKSKGKGLAVKTVQNVHICLRSALQEAYRQELIEKNPASLVKVPTYKATQQKRSKIEIFTIEEQRRLEAALPNNTFGNAIMFCLHTGMRSGELLALQWSDIDYHHRRININKEVSRINNLESATERKTILCIRDRVKTDSSCRIISLTPSLIDLLDRQKKHASGSPMIFPGVKGQLLDPSTLRTHYQAILKQADLPHRTIHALRHTFATRALEANVPVKVVSDILGHSSVQFTLDRYSHVLPNLQEAAMLAMENYIAKKVESS